MQKLKTWYLQQTASGVASGVGPSRDGGASLPDTPPTPPALGVPATGADIDTATAAGGQSVSQHIQSTPQERPSQKTPKQRELRAKPIDHDAEEAAERQQMAIEQV